MVPNLRSIKRRRSCSYSGLWATLSLSFHPLIAHPLHVHTELLVMSYLIFYLINIFISCFLFYFSSGSDTIKVLVGNKCDLKDKREVNEDDIKVSVILPLTLDEVAWLSL